MLVRVLLFAAARDFAQASALSIELPERATVAQLRSAIAREHPALASLLSRSAIAVNHDFADDHHLLEAHDEVAVIPPVSGG